jgi:hypothetical protein
MAFRGEELLAGVSPTAHRRQSAPSSSYHQSRAMAFFPPSLGLERPSGKGATTAAEGFG